MHITHSKTSFSVTSSFQFFDPEGVSTGNTALKYGVEKVRSAEYVEKGEDNPNPSTQILVYYNSEKKKSKRDF
jgi:hypothetical protein